MWYGPLLTKSALPEVSWFPDILPDFLFYFLTFYLFFFPGRGTLIFYPVKFPDLGITCSFFLIFLKANEEDQEKEFFDNNGPNNVNKSISTTAVLPTDDVDRGVGSICAYQLSVRTFDPMVVLLYKKKYLVVVYY